MLQLNTLIVCLIGGGAKLPQYLEGLDEQNVRDRMNAARRAHVEAENKVLVLIDRVNGEFDVVLIPFWMCSLSLAARR